MHGSACRRRRLRHGRDLPLRRARHGPRLHDPQLRRHRPRAVAARDTTFKGNVAQNNTDDGIGGLLDRHAMLSNRVSGSRFGIRSSARRREDRRQLAARQLRRRGSRPFGAAGEFRMTGNRRHNTRPCPPAHDECRRCRASASADRRDGHDDRRQPHHRQHARRRHRRQWRRGRARGPDGTPLSDNRVRGNVILGTNPTSSGTRPAPERVRKQPLPDEHPTGPLRLSRRESAFSQHTLRTPIDPVLRPRDRR